MFGQPRARTLPEAADESIYPAELNGNVVFEHKRREQTKRYRGHSAMTRQIIRTPDAPSSALYSQAIKVGSTIYVTGIIGIDPATKQMTGSTIQEQTRQALVNCANILRAASAKLEDVVEVQVLLARPEDFAGLNEEYAKFFPTDPPIRSVARLGPELSNVLVSIKMTAILG
jgi:2-iminobutanoate/2-iminopropanoate deaminase